MLYPLLVPVVCEQSQLQVIKLIVLLDVFFSDNKHQDNTQLLAQFTLLHLHNSSLLNHVENNFLRHYKCYSCIN